MGNRLQIKQTLLTSFKRGLAIDIVAGIISAILAFIFAAILGTVFTPADGVLGATSIKNITVVVIIVVVVFLSIMYTIKGFIATEVVKRIR